MTIRAHSGRTAANMRRRPTSRRYPQQPSIQFSIQAYQRQDPVQAWLERLRLRYCRSWCPVPTRRRPRSKRARRPAVRHPRIDSRPPRAEDEFRMLGYLWVAFGGALGSVARYWVSGAVARHFGETFPWGTVCVNLTG